MSNLVLLLLCVLAAGAMSFVAAEWVIRRRSNGSGQLLDE